MNKAQLKEYETLENIYYNKKTLLYENVTEVLDMSIKHYIYNDTLEFTKLHQKQKFKTYVLNVVIYSLSINNNDFIVHDKKATFLKLCSLHFNKEFKKIKQLKYYLKNKYIF